jgi:hypothetical protein
VYWYSNDYIQVRYSRQCLFFSTVAIKIHTVILAGSIDQSHPSLALQIDGDLDSLLQLVSPGRQGIQEIGASKLFYYLLYIRCNSFRFVDHAI